MYGEHRDLHVLTHSFPTRRSSDLQAVFLGDLVETQRRHHFARADVEADVGFVHRPGLALQADHRLVVQQEAVVGQGLAQVGDPGLHALLLGAVDRARIEDLEAVAADVDRRVDAFGDLGQNLAVAGDLLAELYVGDPDRARRPEPPAANPVGDAR